jgi:taurine dioxygenase
MSSPTSLRTEPLSEALGAEVLDFDLNAGLDDDSFAAIKAAFLEHGLLLFRNQSLDPETHVALSRRFGDLEIHVQKNYLLDGHPEILVIGNEPRPDGKVAGYFIAGEGDWHTDMSYVAKPSLGSLFYAVTVPPEGGDTCFAGARAAWEALPEREKAALDGVRAVHDYPYFDAKLCEIHPDRIPLDEEQLARVPPVAHPIARTHPETGRKALYLSVEVISQVEGMPPEDGRRLCAELGDYVTSDRFVYRHRWKPGDLLIWDNRCTLHKATAYDHRQHVRTMHRTTVKGDVPF